MKKLILKYGADPDKAKDYPSFGAAYNCPECKSGNRLKRFASDLAKCNGCGKTYQIP